MSDESIVRIWKYIIMGFLALVSLCVGSCQMTNYRIEQAIEHGADPIEAACALSEGSSTDSLCHVQISKD